MDRLSTYAISDLRRENLRRYVSSNGGPSAVARRLGHSNGSYLVQMIGPNPSRPVTEKNARAFESQLGLAERYLDQEIAGFLPAVIPTDQVIPTSSSESERIISIVQNVRDVCAEENCSISVSKFAEILVLVFRDDGVQGDAREYARALVRLTK